LEEKIRSIHPHLSEECLEVRTKSRKKYYLQPKFRNLFYIVKEIAQYQGESGNKAVPADKVMEFVKEARTLPSNIRPYERGEYCRIKDPTILYIYWHQRFPDNYWKVADREKAPVSGEKALKILEAVFQHRWSGHNAKYWLGDIPEVEIILDETEVIEGAIRKTTRDMRKDWKRLCEYCERLIESSISRLAHKYNPELYIPRQEIEKQFGEFMKSRQNLFFILGKSGTGKTNLVCHLAEITSFPGLFLSGDLWPLGTFSLQEEIQKSLQPLLHGESTTAGPVNWVNELASKSKVAFLIYIDALNEFADPAAVLQELAALSTRWGAIYAAIKFCVTCRSPTWQNLTKVMKTPLPEQNLYIYTGSRLTRSPLSAQVTPSATLEDFDQEELSAAVEVYRKHANFTGNLSPDAERICRCPLLLRLVAQIWAGKELPYCFGAWELWDTYWETTAAAGPKGSDTFSLEVASAMRKNQATEITEAQFSRLSSYSENRLHHLVETGVLSLQGHKYECWASFTHERLFEYALGRTLLAEKDRILAELPKFLEEAGNFSPLSEAICFLAKMIDDNTCWRFIRQLSATTEKGKELACKVIEELSLASNEAWQILESLSNDVPLDVANAVSEIGASQPHRAIERLSKLIRTREHWSVASAIFFANQLVRLCKKSEFFLHASEQYLKGGSRYNQVALRALSWIDDYTGWESLKQVIHRFSASRDGDLRLAVASVLQDLAQRDVKMARRLLARMAKDAKKEVRYELGWRLMKLLLENSQWLGVLTSLGESKNWHERQVAARAVGYVLSENNATELVSLAKKLSGDPRHEVKVAIAEGLFFFRLPQERFYSVVLPVLEAMISRSTRKDLLAFSRCRFQPDMVAELTQRWSQSKHLKLRELAAKIWRGDIRDIGVDIAFRIATDSSTRVRVAFADTLARDFYWEEQDDAPRVFEIVKRLLNDQDPRVRVFACWAVFRYAEQKKDECITLLLDQMTKNNDEGVKCKAIVLLLALDAEKSPDVGQAIDKSVAGLRSRGHLTKLGIEVGEVAAANELAFDFVCKLSKKHSQVHQHIAISALLVCWVYYEPHKAELCMNMLSEMVRLQPVRAHFLGFAWLMEEVSEQEWDKEAKEKLPTFRKVLKDGATSENVLVRSWATCAAWRCFAFYPTTLRDCAESILKEVAGDHDWRVRFICALYGGAQLIGKSKEADSALLGLLATLCMPLCEDQNDLVRRAAACSVAQLLKKGDATFAKQAKDIANKNFKALTDPYLSGNSEKHFNKLLAQFYCSDFKWVLNELEYEIDALEADRGDLLLEIWREKPEETESLAKKWLKEDSQGLQKTARRFFRNLKKTGALG
jgi:HEAT repeat protein